MSESWLVLGGWALDPHILTPFFGDSSKYVDINLLMPKFVTGGVLRSDWREVAGNEIAPILDEPRLPLAGWSTGAIVALALVDRTRNPRAQLLSATPSFCTREGFPWGADPRAVQVMKRQIRRDRDATLRDFFTRCGLSDPETILCPYPTATLIAGLDFLEQVSLLPLTRPACPVEIIHGAQDAVIPLQAGAFLAESIGASIDVRNGGHVFF